jgi:maltose O-acetyltransferase
MKKIIRAFQMFIAMLLNPSISIKKGSRITGKVSIRDNSKINIGSNSLIDGLEVLGNGILQIGDGVHIKNLFVDFALSNGKILIEDDVYLANGAKLIIFGDLKIGQGTISGPDLMIVDTKHRYGPAVLIKDSGVEVENIEIGKNCWLGGRVNIMPGVIIEDNVVIGAGAVVTKQCISGHVFAGIPARMIN